MEISAPLLLELGVILIVLTVLGTAARRFALSPIPLYLLTGLALGDGGIAPMPAADEFLEAGATIGVVLLLLTLGPGVLDLRVRRQPAPTPAVGVGRPGRSTPHRVRSPAGCSG